jgi:hypothetical protein
MIFDDVSDKIEQTAGGVRLHQNYPNPFHGQTYIKYFLEESCDVEINVFDFIGKKIATLYSARQVPGEHQISWDASGCQNGIYILQLRAGQKHLHKKMILMK